MRVLILLLPVVLMAQTPAKKTPPAKPKAAAVKPKPKPTAPPALATDDDKTVYSLGLMLHRQLSRFDLSPAELELVKRALADGAAGKPAVDPSAWAPKIEALAKARAGRVLDREKVAAKAYLDKAAAEPGAVKTESGLVYREIKPGAGPSPKATDMVKVHYHGTFVNGTVFDSSVQRNQPAQFPLNGVIKCWTEGVQKMKVGGKSILVCPSDIAYGDAGRPGIPPGATLIFEVELLDIPGAPR